MKLKQLLCEKLVQSSWLEDISYYNRHNKLFPGEEVITFKVKGNPKTYIVRGLTRRDYLDWIKGKYTGGSCGKMYHILKHHFNRTWYDTNPFKIIDRSKIKPTKK